MVLWRTSENYQNRQSMRVCASLVGFVLQTCNENDVFLTPVIGLCSGVWFNTSNFPKTEVGSGQTGAPVQTLENLEMKKTLVAIAALTAVSAFAQSSVTLSGTVDVSYINAATTTAAGAKSSTSSLENSKTGTSNITFSGTEDLGGGLKANFLYEMDFDATGTVNGPVAGGQIFAGVAGAFGDFKVGSPNTPALTSNGTRQPFGTKIGGGYNGVNGGGHVRNPGTMMYTTPDFAGLKLSVAQTPRNNDLNANAGANVANATTDKTASITDVGVTYANGPLNAAFSRYTYDTNKKNELGVNYAIGKAVVYFGAHNETLTAGTKQSGSNVALKYALTGNVDLFGVFGTLNDKATANADKTITSMGAQYKLSKRTFVNARLVSEKFDNATNSKIQTALLGLQHNF
jgi:predicted porin